MAHRMTLQNGRTGVTYVARLEHIDGTWRAGWHATSSAGERIEGPNGEASADDAYDAFRVAKRAIEDADDDVVGVDWDFEAPLPPWLG